MPFDRLRAALAEVGLSQAVLSHPETLASLGCFETPIEDWPVSNPFVAGGHRLVDDVIEPAETRRYVAMALEALHTKRELRPPKKHGLIPL